MSVAGVANDRAVRFLRALCSTAGLVVLLAGCSSFPPFNARPAVFSAPEPPGILSHSELPPCPRPAIAQAQWLARNMARTRLGYSKLQVVSLLGDPANSETFSLSNGAAVEVLFYHTPETICRVNSHGEGLMPLVFQDDRLLGYGQNYYRQFLVPMMRVMATPAAVAAGSANQTGVPQARVDMTPAPSLDAAPVKRGRLYQEDLPPRAATPPAGIYAPTPVTRGGNGYTAPMQNDSSSQTPQQDMRPASYDDGGMPFNSLSNSLGRGAPLQ